MNTDADYDNEFDDEITVAADDDAIAAIRAQVAALGDEPTTVMSAGERSDLVGGERGSGEPGDLLGDEPTDVSPPKAAKSSARSLIDGVAPPPATATYWDRRELAAERLESASPSERSLPRGFVLALVGAAIMAAAIAVLVLYLMGRS